MKKVLLALLAVFILFAFVSCDGEQQPPKETDGNTMPEEYSLRIELTEEDGKVSVAELYQTKDGFAYGVPGDGFVKVQRNGNRYEYYASKEDGPFVLIEGHCFSVDNKEKYDLHYKGMIQGLAASTIHSDYLKVFINIPGVKSSAASRPGFPNCTKYEISDPKEGELILYIDQVTKMFVYGEVGGEKWEVKNYKTTGVRLPE